MNLSPIATLTGALPKRSIRQVKLCLKTEQERLARSKDRATTQRDWLIFRAATVWDVDQRERVETFALKLKKQPGQVVARLKTTYHGCQLLIERWAYLMRKVSSDTFTGELTSSDQIKALCLLGIPPDEWNDTESVISTKAISRNNPDWQLHVQDHLKAIFTGEITRLVDLSMVLEVHNKEIQAKAVLGEFFNTDALLNKAEREVARGERQIQALEKERLSATHDESEDALDPPETSTFLDPTPSATSQPDPLL